MIRPPSPRLWIAALAAAAAHAHAQSTHTAYVVPAGTAGNQAFDGALGMDFDVANRIEITQLGCFDDNSDGIQTPIAVRLYNRDTQEVLASATFSPGDDGTLVGGSRFKSLDAVITLPTGFRGTIVGEGYGPSERNGNRQPAPWTTDNGGSSIAFVGTSRYNFPPVPGAFPESPDSGPAARYAAGTFVFRTTPPERPAAPAPAAVPSDAAVDLSWPAVTAPLPAATYRILRSDSPGGDFTQIAEVTTTSFRNINLTNGTLYCYKIIGVASGGQVGLESPVVCARPFNLGTDRFIAYDTPWGIAGTQDFNGALGMDFDVTNPIIVSQLGCFDDNSDGLFTEISVRIYNRDTQEVVASRTFPPDDPGTLAREDGEPIGGMRFKPLDSPVNLPLGFRGVIVAEGYNAMERLNNSFAIPANIRWSTNSGGGSLVFTGNSRYNFPIVPGAFPESPDTLPAQYAAGTFVFETTPPVVPGTPIISARSENHAVRLSWPVVTQPLPAARYAIARSATIEGPFLPIGESTSASFVDSALPNGIEQFYSVTAIATAGQSSLVSNIVSATPAPRAGGVAYSVPAGTPGNQIFGGALGMAFDVERPVIITSLGAFDSAGDGIQQPISVRLYDRDAYKVVASATFEPGNDGNLIDGSRFLPLATPLALPAGFKGMIVTSGYGDLEPNGNAGSTPLGLTTFAGGCLAFTGRSFYSVDASAMADTADGGPANRYAAGSFTFEPDVPPANLTISRNPDGSIKLEWSDPTGVLERSRNLSAGPWDFLPSATSGFTTPASDSPEFFRLTR